MKRNVLFLCTLLMAQWAVGQILVETESFADKGGWVSDHQAFEQIRSSYLMAHGLGRPVKDAVTSVSFAEGGRYHLYVSTYNWTAPWYDGKGPGAFQVLVDGRPLAAELGVTGNRWEWQYAGEVTVSKGTVQVALHDLTGFNGRADALYFTKVNEAPTADYQAFAPERLRLLGYDKPTRVSGADLVVVGGGIAGCATALTAARYGLKVVLVDNLPWLGGNHALGVRANGLMYENLYPELGNITCQILNAKVTEKNNPEAYFVRENQTGYIRSYYPIPNLRDYTGPVSTLMQQAEEHVSMIERRNLTKPEQNQNNNEYRRKQQAEIRKTLLEEAGVAIYQHIHAYKVVARDGQIASITGKHLQSGEEFLFEGQLFVDCTGDGVIGYLAGAEYRMGRESKAYAKEPSAPEQEDQKKMGMSMHWYAYPRENSGTFPTVEELPWAMQCTKESATRGSQWSWEWETGLEVDNALNAELARDNYFRAVFGNWAYLKNNEERFKGYRLDYLQYIGMKRESRRIMGDLVLTENDIVNRVKYPDASFTTTWTMDLHYATPKQVRYFKGWEWMTYCTNGKEVWIRPYHVPYRCLYAKDIANLFIGGRCMSVTHQALGTVRVQATLGMAGEVIGMAASLCAKHGVLPRDVYRIYLNDLKKLMRAGAPLR